MKEEEIIKAYCKIRIIDQTIPDEVLDFMKDTAIEKIKSLDENELYYKMKNKVENSGRWAKDGSHYRHWKYGMRTLEEAYEIQFPHLC